MKAYSRALAGALMLGAVAAATGATPYTFTHAGIAFEIEVGAMGADGFAEYQLVARDELRTLSRLSVRRRGMVRDAWLGDVDHDGRMEVIVSTVTPDADARGEVDIHEWQTFRFVTSRPQALTGADLNGYRGTDQFSYERGMLRRAFPVIAADGAHHVSSDGLARFVYSPASNAWVREAP